MTRTAPRRSARRGWVPALAPPFDLRRSAPAFALLLVAGGICPPQMNAQTPPTVTSDTIARWMTELSNRGRWGADDDRGTLNLITPEARVQAASLVRSGVTVSLSHDYLTEPSEDVSSPLQLEVMGAETPGPWLSDRLGIAYHGFGHSHMDAICHMSHDGLIYNGLRREEVATVDGCVRAGVDVASDGIVGRGVLMDIARLKGMDYLEPGTAILVEDLEAWEARSGIRVRSGDILLVRAGRWARRAELGPWAIGRNSVGLHPSVLPWLRQRGVAMLGSDYTNDLLPSPVAGVDQPIHQVTLVAMGMPLFDNLDLEALGDTAAGHGRWEFLLVAAPLRVPGGTGSPLNPIAIF
jgi:kynurenine formamidase